MKKILFFTLIIPSFVFSQNFFQVKISSKHLNLREKPNDSSDVVKKLRKNQKIIKISEKKEWLKVVTQNQDTGYVFKKYTTPLTWIINKNQLKWGEKKIKKITIYTGEIEFNDVSNWTKDTVKTFVDAGLYRKYVYYNKELTTKTSYTYDKYGRTTNIKKEEYNEEKKETLYKEEMEYKDKKCYQSPTTIKYNDGGRDVIKNDTNTCKKTHGFWYDEKDKIYGKETYKYQNYYPWRIKKITTDWIGEETIKEYDYKAEKLISVGFFGETGRDSLITFEYHKERDANNNVLYIKEVVKYNKKGLVKDIIKYYVKEKNITINSTWSDEHEKNIFKKEEVLGFKTHNFFKTTYKRDKHKNIKEEYVYNGNEELISATKYNYEYIK